MIFVLSEEKKTEEIEGKRKRDREREREGCKEEKMSIICARK